MRYVEVLCNTEPKHPTECTSILYWFPVPDCLSHLINIGSMVMYKSDNGEQSGIVVRLVDGFLPPDEPLPRERDANWGFDPISITAVTNVCRYGGDYCFLKPEGITGVFMDFEMSEIHIPWFMQSSTPAPGKIEKRIREFYGTGAFDTRIVCSADKTLKDGYTAYLVAKMFGHETIRGICRPD